MHTRKTRKEALWNLEALPPDLRDLTLGPGLLDREQVDACSLNPGPESALELLPSSALSSAQVRRA
jgi:hypothetical protein